MQRLFQNRKYCLLKTENEHQAVGWSLLSMVVAASVTIFGAKCSCLVALAAKIACATLSTGSSLKFAGKKEGAHPWRWQDVQRSTP